MRNVRHGGTESVNIRAATVDDCEGIARVHVESWKSTYKGIVPEAYLAALTVEKRARNWNWTFANLALDELILLAESEEQGIVGFASGGKCRYEQMNYGAELYTIYLLKEAQGQGIGSRLFHSIADSLNQKGYSSIMLWVLKDNPSVRFYTKLGGQFLQEKEIVIGGERLSEIALGWPVI